MGTQLIDGKFGFNLAVIMHEWLRDAKNKKVLYTLSVPVSESLLSQRIWTDDKESHLKPSTGGS